MSTTSPPERRDSGLPAFIRTHLEFLLREWDRTAAIAGQGLGLDIEHLRDHAREILFAVADDMELAQSDRQQFDKSIGRGPSDASPLDEAARLHGLGRLSSRFNLDRLALELRALRASVLRSLELSGQSVPLPDIVRFNEAIDQVLTGSITAYADQLARVRALEHESELRRQLLQRTEAAQEADRTRIARELHDSLGQKLTAMSLFIGQLDQQVISAFGHRQLDSLRSLLKAADRELDHIVFQLRPIALDGQTLAEALPAYVDTWSQLAQLPVDLVIDGMARTPLPEPVEIAVFRVIQEALNNVAKHAHAARVGLTVQAVDGDLVVSVEDDGVGFDPAHVTHAPERPSWGLAGMRERIESLGGEFALETSPGQGCCVLIRVPMNRQARGHAG